MSEEQGRTRLGVDVQNDVAVLIKALAKLDGKTVQELLEVEMNTLAEKAREEVKRRLMI